jgi:hypothetical protein
MADWFGLIDQACRPPEPVAAPLKDGSAATAPDDQAERAAIIHVDGNIPVEWAEGAARLFAMPPPPLVPDRRWRELMISAALFLDRWAPAAAELGWTAHDVFGCDPHRPVQRLDQHGLIWQLHGAAIVSMTAVGATVRTAAGPVLSISRRAMPENDCRINAWEISALPG